MHFEGEVRTEWLRHEGEDRRMQLIAPFAFVDDHGARWVADIGDVIDGASIPPELWAIVGAPFVGDYRRPSVLHDVACAKRIRTSREVHRMFYDAMRTDGVPAGKALRFYTAVRLFGPSWERNVSGDLRMFSATASPALGLTIDEVEQALDLILPH